MKDFAQSLREGIDRRPAALPDAPILVYGAGSRGKEVAEFLLGRGYELLGFADAAASGYERWRDLPIRTLTDWQRASLADAVTIVVAIHNHQVDIACLLDRLSKVAAGRIVNPSSFKRSITMYFRSRIGWRAGCLRGPPRKPGRLIELVCR
jgi:hypothetical protein